MLADVLVERGVAVRNPDFKEGRIRKRVPASQSS